MIGRFLSPFDVEASGLSAQAMTQEQMVALFQKAGYDVMKMKTLRTVNGKPGFSLAQEK